MSSEPPPGSGPHPPDDDPLRKRPPSDQGAGSPYDPPPEGGTPPPPGGSQPPPHDGGNPYGSGGDPYGNGPYGGGSGGGDPYGGGPHGGGNPYGGGGPHGGGGPYDSGGYPTDPLAGMPPLADSGKRTLARIVDMIIVGIVVYLLTWAFGVREYDVNGDTIDAGKSLGQSVVAAVLYVAYDTILTARHGQTLGKKWFHMRVANLDNGATPSFQTSLIRALVLWIPFAFCCACVWTAICGGWSYFDRPYKQGLDDKAAKTVVVSTR
ncbi:RDD family protein [Streptomyces sp. NPDC090108]|uniref:RDD family protein n=1 Tax=Streptomyces sp. NPDC090108 TaxID=3365947 RepID=UPI00381E95BA